MDYLLTDPLGQLLLGVGGVIGFAALAFAITTSGARDSLWGQLAQQFPESADDLRGESFPVRARFHQNSFGNMNPSYQFTGIAGRDHLHLRMFLPLRRAYPTISTPWSRIVALREGSGGAANLRLRIQSSPPITLGMHMRSSGEPLLRAAGDRLTRDEGSAND